jgi:hypothetical protein
VQQMRSGSGKLRQSSGRHLWLVFAICIVLPGIASSQKANTVPSSGSEYSGMYSFLREGEFVQITVEDAGHVSGFVKRYGDLDSDKGELLDHFFKTAHLDGNRLSFATEMVHGVAFDFQGTVAQVPDRRPGDEGYYLIEGKLTETSSDEHGKPTSRERGLTLKSLARRNDSVGRPSS